MLQSRDAHCFLVPASIHTKHIDLVPHAISELWIDLVCVRPRFRRRSSLKLLCVLRGNSSELLEHRSPSRWVTKSTSIPQVDSTGVPTFPTSFVCAQGRRR